MHVHEGCRKVCTRPGYGRGPLMRTVNESGHFYSSCASTMQQGHSLLLLPEVNATALLK
jgi:hypothetical protein